MATTAPDRAGAFHVMTKPTGPLCNLGCRYCFYLEKEKLYPDTRRWAMKDEVLASYVRQYIEAQDVPEVVFAWQGGEPTILGVAYFQQVVALQQQFANGKRIRNSFQTNGTLLDDAWGAFFAEHGFLVGISIDGPDELHDHYRVNKGGKGSLAQVLRGLEVLKRHEVAFNTLTCVNRQNAAEPLRVYRFLKEIGSTFLQFIPVVERQAGEEAPHGLALITPEFAGEARVSPWSVRPRQYGTFLTTIFDEWARKDAGEIFVQLFDETLAAWAGVGASLCVYQPTCGGAMALESNGDLYACDHFVYPEHRLGNLMETPLRALVDSEAQKRFGRAKQDTLPAHCLACKFRFACHGECPKHRFLSTPDGEPGLNYLCEGLQQYFEHTAPHMRYMAAELHARRPAWTVRRFARQLDLEASTRRRSRGVAPNALCPCGSGRKHKKCCGRGR